MFPVKNFELLWLKKAVKSLQKIPQQYQTNTLKILDGFQKDPNSVDLKKIQGFTDSYRIRMADYRIILKVIKQEKKVFVVIIGHRKDVYEILKTLNALQIK